jgi:urate oxidase
VLLRSFQHALHRARFSTTYSSNVQDSLYRMGEAVLAAVPEISEISMACPNMHFIPMNLSASGLDNNNDVFLPTDEPHGQIECITPDPENND